MAATEFDWAGYLVLAKELADRSDEASRRSAISRAYYAAFGVAREYVARRRLAVITRTADDHRIVWEAFRNQSSRELRGISGPGKDLLRSRHRADYENSVLDLSELVEDSILVADDILGRLAPRQRF